MSEKYKSANNLTIFASCPRGLEDVLMKEISEFPVYEVIKRDGGALLQCDFETTLLLMINLRTASRVFLHLFDFNFDKEKEIYRQVKYYDWDSIFSTKQTFKIATLLDRYAKVNFKNSMMLSLIAKDGIVDWFRNQCGERPSVETTNPDVSLLLRVDENPQKRTFIGSFYVDLCGTPLSHRGYRAESHNAPIRENLAAGLVLLSDWDKKEILIDPMCGSATILIEAALIKHKIPPSYLKIKEHIENRKEIWSFENHTWFRQNIQYKNTFEHVVKKSYADFIDLLPLNDQGIVGSDIDDNSIKLARKTARKAMLFDAITIEQYDACCIFRPEVEKGLIITNPPYGERLSSKDEADDLLTNFSEHLKKEFKGFRLYIITEGKESRKSISLKTTLRTPLFNGNIECRLLRYDFY